MPTPRSSRLDDPGSILAVSFSHLLDALWQWRNPTTKSTTHIHIGNKTPIKDKLVQLIGIVLLLLLGLSGSTGILGKKRAEYGGLKGMPTW